MPRDANRAEAAGERPLPLPLDATARLPEARGNVRLSRHAFAGGLRLYDTRITAFRDLKLHPEVPHDLPFIGAQVALSGRVTMLLPDGPRTTASARSDSLFRPRGRDACSHIAAGQSLRLIGVAADLPLLVQWFGPRIPPQLRPYLADRTRVSHSATLRVPAARAAASALLRPRCAGPLQAMFLEGVAMQMMASFLDTLCGSAQGVPGASSRERRAALEARALLLDRLDAPPTAGELGRAVGLSAPRLQQLFREIFGCSVFSYVRHARLEHALLALQETTLPVKTVAWHAGYRHVANFSRAFQARFGIAPSGVRGTFRHRRIPG